VSAQTAHISEEVRTLPTYPFDEPDPIPILTRDARLYPYHSFEGYAAAAVPRKWKVVHLENDWIEVFVLPEVGGKVWGARVKRTGHWFIYRNEVLKFRNIALRGPWTSGGIEFNFGVIGHAPSTATPVDYRLAENDDGSVSCFVGGMDLPSRTEWRVEIRLPADKAAFETHVSWSNPTPLEQPYYSWMTGAASARSDLVMTIPGDAYLGHPGDVHPWPVDAHGRDLSVYRNNDFGGNKSYHVVGELNDFFGGYYRDEGYGFGQWARYEELPGQKLWLWALSRQGGIWEDLLTDTDGQYVEFQAGRLFVQYQPGAEVNPITQAGFPPGSSSRWSETWFPLEETGGLSDASDRGALYLSVERGRATIGVNAFTSVADTLEVWSGDERVAALPLELSPLEAFDTTVAVTPGRSVRARVKALDLDYDTDPSARRLSRPFETDPGAFPSMSEAERTVFQARERMKGRWYADARALFDRALAIEPWNPQALLGMSELEYREGHYQEGLKRADEARQLDAYGAEANFLAGLHERALGRTADARDAFGWAARSMAYRSVAYTQLAGIMIGEARWKEAARYARLSLDYDRFSVPAWTALAVVGRLSGDNAMAAEALGRLDRLDPLHHAALAESYLTSRSPAATRALVDSLGGEYPDQTLLELAVNYADLGLDQDALALLEIPTGRPVPAVNRAWRAFLRHDPSLLADAGTPAFQFPYRRESLPVLAWADAHATSWIWTYLHALNLWGVDRPSEAANLMDELGDEPDYGAAYAARGLLLKEVRGADPVPDLRRAVALDSSTRVLRVALVRALQERSAWTGSLEALAEARARFPDDFNLALLETRSLLEVGRASDAARILASVQVLPSENARESHHLFEWAHTLLALDALDGGDPARAAAQLDTALTWPESLGQGRPYEPEDRIDRFLLGVTERRLGHGAQARAHFQHVIDATREARADGAPGSRLDLLAIPALQALGKETDTRPLAQAPDSLFQDLEGRILRRTLTLGETR
jgi:tetratricopeptide (TPR) repeat protein